MIGLCIKYFNKNYGSVLQSLATIKFVEKAGWDYRIIRYVKKKNLKYIFDMGIRAATNPVFRRDIYELFQKKSARIIHKGYKINDLKRAALFDDFIENNFEGLTEYYIGYDKLIQGSENYDIIVSGSDQLWSPSGLMSHFYTLEFCAPQVKRVSWASSFGVSEIPSEQIENTRKYLSEMDYISCREASGCKIVEKLTGTSAKHVCDPVLMFDENGWNELVSPEPTLCEKYVFAYFLGNNVEQRKYVTDFAIKNNLKIVTLRHLDQYVPEDETFGDYALYDVSPERFINLIRNAAYVCTDSFHGTCFSLIFKKNFTVFNRYKSDSKVSKNTRIDSLCQKLGIGDRRFNGEVIPYVNRINYEEVDKRLCMWRKESEEYLLSAIGNSQNIHTEVSKE